MTTTSFGKWFVQEKNAAVRIIIIYYYYMHVILLFRPAGKYDLNEDFDPFFFFFFCFISVSCPSNNMHGSMVVGIGFLLDSVCGC